MLITKNGQSPVRSSSMTSSYLIVVGLVSRVMRLSVAICDTGAGPIFREGFGSSRSIEETMLLS